MIVTIKITIELLFFLYNCYDTIVTNQRMRDGGGGGHKIPPVMFMKWAVVDNENSNLWVARAMIAHVEKHTQRIGLCVLGNF